MRKLFGLFLIVAVVAIFSNVSVHAQSAPAWAANTPYAVGNLVTYGGGTYKCLQAHTSQIGWEPPNVPALWTLNRATHLRPLLVNPLFSRVPIRRDQALRSAFQLPRAAGRVRLPHIITQLFIRSVNKHPIMGICGKLNGGRKVKFRAQAEAVSGLIRVHALVARSPIRQSLRKHRLDRCQRRQIQTSRLQLAPAVM